MCEALAHRGPDATGIYTDDHAGFGHRRLSIIDLSSGANQPFHNKSGRYVIVFNGEIYNYQEVKKELDYPWVTTSDTEVILAAYIRWGRECLNRLNGMFALVIWDKEEKQLFIARDRLGVKPFYYYHNHGTFIFASEIRAILSTGMVPRKIDRNSLADYLVNMTVRTPSTMIQNVVQLAPGQCGTFRDGKLELHNYWSLVKDNPSIQSDHKTVLAKTRTMFEEAVRSRMVADVKVGAFLSGGIDSSAVVACMSQQTSQTVETFSIIFKDKEFDESEYSRLISERYGTRHTELLLEPQELIANLPEYISAMDTPTVDGINTYIVSKLVARTGIKVVLTGIGGDELFAGYPGFGRWLRWQKYGWLAKIPVLPSVLAGMIKLKRTNASLKLASFLQGRDKSLNGFYTNSRRLYRDAEVRQLMGNMPQPRRNWLDLDSKAVKQYPGLSQYSIGELSNYTLDVLMKDTDQMSMASALEVREPFFDYRFIEYALQISDDIKSRKDTPKTIFVEALGDLLPKEIVYRPKKGFSFPWKHWLRNELKDYCESAIESLVKRRVFDEKGLRDMWRSFLDNKNGITWIHIWSLVILQKWMEENSIEA